MRLTGIDRASRVLHVGPGDGSLLLVQETLDCGAVSSARREGKSILTSNEVLAVRARVAAHVRDMRLHLRDEHLLLLALRSREGTLEDVVCGRWSEHSRENSFARHVLANWSFIMMTSGLTPSAVGIMISSIRCARVSESAKTRAFSQTFDANLWRARARI